MANLGSLVVSLEANMARFTSDMDRAAQHTEKAMAKIQSGANMAVTALGAIGVAVSVDALLGVVSRSIGALADLDDMAQKTGASVENLSKLGKIANMTSTDFGAVDAVIVKLAKNMADVDGQGGKVRAALEAIGLSADGIERKDPSQLFVEITRSLQGYEDGAGKVALMNDLMGKSAADLIPYMNDVAEQFDNVTGESEEAAAAAAKFQDDIGVLRLKFDEWTTSVITAALPAANDFVGALTDLSRESKSVTGNNVASWADDTAIGLARLVDVVALMGRGLSAVSGSFKVVAADIKFLNTASENTNPFKAALKIAQGGNPLEDIKKAAEERNAVLDDANRKWDDLWNVPANRMEQAILTRIAGRHNLDTASIDALAGMAPPVAVAPAVLNYGGTPIPTRATAGTKAPRAASGGRSPEERALEEAAKREAAEAKRLADEQRRAEEDVARQVQQNESEVESIRMSLLSQAGLEDEMHLQRLEALQTFHDTKLENVTQANALIEEENARHEQAKAEMQAQYDIQSLGMAGSTADQLYSMMRAAGKEQTALGKAVFLASKAIAVAEIILSTEVAAAKAGMQLGIFGLPMAAMIRATGYASAGMVAGMAIAEASAEGGFDIPAGTNPVTQLHEREMVLPKAQADVIRGLATRGVAGDGGAMQLTIVNNTRSSIGNVTEQRISATERALIIEEAVSATASTFADPNSKTSRAMNRNFNLSRSR